jgi:hypothetical protein
MFQRLAGDNGKLAKTQPGGAGGVISLISAGVAVTAASGGVANGVIGGAA